VARLKYAGLIKAQKRPWGSVYLWRAAREGPFGSRGYVYLTVYVKARDGKWVQATVYLDSVEGLAEKLVGAARDPCRSGNAPNGS